MYLKPVISHRLNFTKARFASIYIDLHVQVYNLSYKLIFINIKDNDILLKRLKICFALPVLQEFHSDKLSPL